MTTLTQTLLDGNQHAFRPRTLTPMQKLTLRFVVVGLVYYAFAAIEGMIMRLYQVKPFDPITPTQYFGILTAHPLVGIFGSSREVAIRLPPDASQSVAEIRAGRCVIGRVIVSNIAAENGLRRDLSDPDAYMRG